MTEEQITRIVRIDKYLSRVEAWNGAMWVEAYTATHAHCQEFQVDCEARHIVNTCDFSAWMRNTLKRAGWDSHGDMGKACKALGITRPTLHRRLRGDGVPSLPSIRKIALCVAAATGECDGVIMAQILEVIDL